MWQKVKEWASAHSGTVSLATFILFFLWLSYFIEWPVALIIAVSLAIHEYSHVWVMKRIGLKIEGVVFIPFLGAIAFGGGDKILSRKQECLMALAGPLMGYLSAIPVLAALLLTENKIFAKGFYFVVLINLFNMLPLSPLDGGRIVKSILMSMKNQMAGFFVWGAIGIAVSFILFRLQVSLLLIVLILWMALQELKNEYQIYQIHREADGILAACDGSSAEEERRKSEEEYSESERIVRVSAMLKRVLAPLNLKQKIVFTMVYITLAGWPFAAYYFAG